MSSETTSRDQSRGVGALRGLLYGSRDPRVRATWRVLLAMPVLWVFTGAVLTGNLQAGVDVIPAGQEQYGGLTQSVLHAVFLVVALAGWARYLDRRPLTEYGVSATPQWVLRSLVGFAAVVGGHAAWFALGALLGDTSITVALSAGGESLLVGVVVPVVALVLHAAVQQVVFFRVLLGNAVEGLQSRGASGWPLVAGALAVTAVVFVAMHGSTTPLRVFDLVVAAGVFGLLYLHTGDLALGIGGHFGALYAEAALFVPASATGEGPVVFEVSGSLPGVLGTLGEYGLPKMVLAYVLVVAWLRWRQGDVSLEAVGESSVGDA